MTEKILLTSWALAALLIGARVDSAPPAEKRVVAHRGASAYAPEHTAAAYRLALEQGADYVEQDLAVTRDGVLICLHDESLERTTNVEDVFPDRATVDASGRRRWLAADFTLAEVKTLDAGTWFDPTFADERILTFDEAIDLIGSRAGLYPELKSPALYRNRNVDIVALFAAVVQRRGLAVAMADGRPRLVAQSFDEQAVRELTATLTQVPRTFLIGGGAVAERWLRGPETLKEMAAFATDLGASKGLITRTPAIVEWAHAAGMTVTPYTFRAAGQGAAELAAVGAEMRHFLYELGVDALFTDNPDRFPRQLLQNSYIR